MEEEKNSLVSFKEIFPAPFTLKSAGRIHDANGNFCMDAFEKDELDTIVLLMKLNGEIEEKPSEGIFCTEEDQPTKICFRYNDGKMGAVLRVRGWGRLIGGGGMNLDPIEAAQVQDGFINWIVDTLNK